MVICILLLLMIRSIVYYFLFVDDSLKNVLEICKLFKGTVHHKIKILKMFTYTQFVPNLCKLFVPMNPDKDIWKNAWSQLLVTI